MKTLRERWEPIAAWWQKTKEVNGWDYDTMDFEDGPASSVSSVSSVEPRNGKKTAGVDQKKIAMVLAFLALPSCATAPDGLRGVLGTDRGIEHPDNTFHRAAGVMMADMDAGGSRLTVRPPAASARASGTQTGAPPNEAWTMK